MKKVINYTFTRPPKALARKTTRLDNIALVPASLLPYKEAWQQIANRMPAGSVLVCVPTTEGRQKETFLSVARSLRDKGMSVRAVAAEYFCKRSMQRSA
jgi:hypothetical protein